MQIDANKLLRALFVLIWILAGLHITAEYFYWYWTYRWFDIPMHFLGGVWLGLGGIWFVYYSGYIKNGIRTLPRIVAALVAGICVGIAWEVYEYAVWMLTGAGLPSQYLVDTLLDIVMDTTGALCGFVLHHYIATNTARANII